MIRLRQVALVANDLDPVIDELCSAFDLSVCFRDPGIIEFGLQNALMMIGDQVLEVVAPVREGTTAGRLLDKRNGDGGYMAIYEVDDLDARLEHLSTMGVRVVWQADAKTIRGRHLHPRDVGGTLASVDEPKVWGTWEWAGPSWTSRAGVATGIAGVVIGADDPAAMKSHWRELGLDVGVRFQDSNERGEGLDEVELVANDRERVGESRQICGVTFRLV